MSAVTEVKAKNGDCAVCTAPMSRLLLPASIRGLPKTSVVTQEPSIGLNSWFAPPHCASGTASSRTPGVTLVPRRGVRTVVYGRRNAVTSGMSPGGSVMTLGSTALRAVAS